MDNEFPKCPYLGNELYAEYKVVFNESEESAAKEAGFGVDSDKPAKKAAK